MVRARPAVIITRIVAPRMTRNGALPGTKAVERAFRELTIPGRGCEAFLSETGGR